jgi:phage tail-like protein
MSRGLVAELDSPHQLGDMLPALFQEDEFAQRMCRALDEVLAPVFATLDCQEYYFDPTLTPVDFLDWLAGWVGVILDQNWPEARRRAWVEQAGELYRWQGTARGIAQYVALYTGQVPLVTDSGGVVWSGIPDGEVPGSPTPEVVVEVTVSDPTTVDTRHLDAIVAAAKPAHVAHRVEVVKS